MQRWTMRSGGIGLSRATELKSLVLFVWLESLLRLYCDAEIICHLLGSFRALQHSPNTWTEHAITIISVYTCPYSHIHAKYRILLNSIKLVFEIVTCLLNTYLYHATNALRVYKLNLQSRLRAGDPSHMAYSMSCRKPKIFLRICRYCFYQVRFVLENDRPKSGMMKILQIFQPVK